MKLPILSQLFREGKTETPKKSANKYWNTLVKGKVFYLEKFLREKFVISCKTIYPCGKTQLALTFFIAVPSILAFFQNHQPILILCIELQIFLWFFCLALYPTSYLAILVTTPYF